MFRYNAAVQSGVNTGFDTASDSTSRALRSSQIRQDGGASTSADPLASKSRRSLASTNSTSVPADGLPQLKASLFDLAMVKSGDYASPVNPEGLMKQGSSTQAMHPSCGDGNSGESRAEVDTGTTPDSGGKDADEAVDDRGAIERPDVKKQISPILEEAGDDTPLIGTGSVDSMSLPGEISHAAKRKQSVNFATEIEIDNDDTEGESSGGLGRGRNGHAINANTFLSRFEDNPHSTFSTGGTKIPLRRQSLENDDEMQEAGGTRITQSFTMTMGAALKKRISRLVHYTGDSDPFASFNRKSTSNLLSLGLCIDNERSARAVNPESTILLYWETWVLITTICIAMVTPYEVGHYSNGVRLGFEFWLNRQADVVFFLDMLLMFRLAYFDKTSGLWVFEMPKIKRLYLRGNFGFDLTTCVPYDLIMFLLDINGYLSMEAEVFLRLMRLLRVGRLLRPTRATQRMAWVVSMDFSMMQLTKYIMYAVVFAHWLACGWSLVAVLERYQESNWVMDFFGVGVQEVQEFSLYIASLYWAVMTVSTIGYGDIVPVNSLERGFVIFAMLLGAFAYGYIIGAVSGIVATRDAKRNIFYSTMDGLNSFMSSSKLPHGLRVKLREYFTYKCNSSVDVQGYNQLLQAMSPALRSDVAMFMNSHWIANVKHFRNCESVFITQVALHMKHIVYPPAEVIIEVGERLDLLYIVKRGIAVGRGRLFTTGKVFGEDALYKPGEASFTVRSLTFCDITCISSQTFTDLIASFPDSAVSFRNQALKSLMHEEIMAYCQAYRQVSKEMHKGKGGTGSGYSHKADSQHLDNENANEEMDVVDKLAEEQHLSGGDMTSNRRVQFYESKLRMFILVDDFSYAKYTRYAISIQRLWRNHAKRTKRRQEEKTKMLESFITGLGNETQRDMERQQTISSSRRKAFDPPRDPRMPNDAAQAAAVTQTVAKHDKMQAIPGPSLDDLPKAAGDGSLSALGTTRQDGASTAVAGRLQSSTDAIGTPRSSIEAPTPEETSDLLMSPRQQAQQLQQELVAVDDARVNEIEDRMDAFYEEMKILKQAIQLTAVAVTKHESVPGMAMSPHAASSSISPARPPQP